MCVYMYITFCVRFFWERSLNEVPHAVVFVFDGSADPFLDQESLSFFKIIFEDCTNHGNNNNNNDNCVSLCVGYEPVIVVTHLDIICRSAQREGKNWEIEVHHKKDQVCLLF